MSGVTFCLRKDTLSVTWGLLFVGGHDDESKTKVLSGATSSQSEVFPRPLIAAGCAFTNGAARVRARIWLLPSGWIVISSSHEVVSTALTFTPWLATLKFRAHCGDDVLRGMTDSPNEL